MLASEPVGGRSRVTELPCFSLWITFLIVLCHVSRKKPNPFRSLRHSERDGDFIDFKILI